MEINSTCQFILCCQPLKLTLVNVIICTKDMILSLQFLVPLRPPSYHLYRGDSPLVDVLHVSNHFPLISCTDHQTPHLGFLIHLQTHLQLIPTTYYPGDSPQGDALRWYLVWPMLDGRERSGRTDHAHYPLIQKSLEKVKLRVFIHRYVYD